MTTFTTIQLKDDRTGISYAIQANEENREYALKKLREKMDYDFLESLPPKVRADRKKHDIDFTCPHCLEKTQVSSRKEKITRGFLLFFSTELVDIFKCHKCDKEFFYEDLKGKQDQLNRQNIVIENFENWKEAKKQGKNPPEFIKINKVDEVIISSF